MGYPCPSSPSVTRVMRGNRRVDTRPEMLLRSELHRRGLRFRKHLAIDALSLRVRPDIVFTGQRFAVFVDGCFWHGCAQHGTHPRSNSAYWEAKLARNRARDEIVQETLQSAGWQVLRIWEHVPPAAAAEIVAKAVAEAGDHP